MVWWYLLGASEEHCRRLLEVNDFHIQEAAAWRLGRFGSVSALKPLQKLANTVVPLGRVDQACEGQASGGASGRSATP